MNNLRLEKRDYVFIKGKDGKQKPLLLRVSQVGELSSLGRHERLPHLKKEQIEFKPEEVLVNLGKSPAPGKLYGYDLGSRYRKTEVHPYFGEIHYFAIPDEQSKARFERALDQTEELLKKNRLGFLLDHPTAFEVVPKHGKYAGKYIHSNNPETKPSQIGRAHV